MSFKTIDREFEDQLGKLLVERKHLRKNELALCRRVQEASRKYEKKTLPLPQLLVQKQFCTQAEVASASKTLGRSGVFAVDLPFRIRNDLKIRVDGVEDGRLLVSSIRPLSSFDRMLLVRACHDKGLLSVHEVVDSVGSSNDILESLRAERLDPELLRQRLEEFCLAPYARSDNEELLNLILYAAVEDGASDVHIEFDRNDSTNCLLYTRVDGVRRVPEALTCEGSRLLIAGYVDRASQDSGDMAAIQDGAFSFFYRDNRKISVRMSATATVAGKSLTLRLIDSENAPSLATVLSPYPALLGRFEGIFASPANGKVSGMVLLSGPTGSGKSTTMGACIHMADRVSQKLVTVEDPVEAVHAGVVQVQVSSEHGRSFAQVLRGFLRQDPELIAPGELRDPETVQTAINAADSGHLVASTVHAGNAPDTLVKLLNYLPKEFALTARQSLASSLRLICNQVLTRRLCECAASRGNFLTFDEATDTEKDVWQELGVPLQARLLRRDPQGCFACGEDGLSGRMLVPEVLYFSRSQETREAVWDVLKDPARSAWELLRVPGVEHITRKDSLTQLVQSNLIDLEQAHVVLREHG